MNSDIVGENDKDEGMKGVWCDEARQELGGDIDFTGFTANQSAILSACRSSYRVQPLYTVLERASRTSSEQEINFLETSVGIYVRGTAASAAACAAVAAGADAGGGPDADGGSDGGGGRISLPGTCPCTSDDSVLPIESSRVPSP
ncbi:hypothetical protein V1477_011608 [Vespula maculifrons]|uniref:Uncharacterized protein n=1 Tax=Vespula maculifrons TaxID=7453 RepID=A0ABD2BZP0_VESMC